MTSQAAVAIQLVSSRARVPSPRVWTVILCSPIAVVRTYVNHYLKGATLVQRGRFCAVQHPSFEEYGEDGLYDIALAHKLPVQFISRRAPL